MGVCGWGVEAGGAKGAVWRRGGGEEEELIVCVCAVSQMQVKWVVIYES